MKNSLKLVTIKGISIFVHWSFLFLPAWAVMAGLMTGMNWPDFLWSLLFVAAVFICVALHELGHALIAGQVGIAAKTIVLLPLGGIASIEKLPDNPKQELAISAAGPLMSFVIAMGISLFIPVDKSIWSIPAGDPVVTGDNFLFALYMANIALAFLNLVPAFPLDGGRILRALLGLRLNYVRATTIVAITGKVVAWLLIAAGLLIQDPVPPLIGVFLLLFGDMEENYLRLKALVRGVKLKEALMHDYDKLEAGLTVNEAAGFLMNNQSRYFIIMEDGNAIGSVNRMEIVKAIAERNYELKLRDLMKDNLVFLDGEAEVEGVIDKLARNQERIYPVKEQDRFTGVISFQHIIEYLLVNKADTPEYGRLKTLSGLL